MLVWHIALFRTKSPYSHLFRALVHDAVRSLQLEVLPDALDLVQVPLAFQRVALFLGVLSLLRKFKVTALPTHEMSCIEHLIMLVLVLMLVGIGVGVGVGMTTYVSG